MFLRPPERPVLGLRPLLAVGLGIILVAMPACSDDGGNDRDGRNGPRTTGQGDPSPGTGPRRCENGFTEPRAGTPLFRTPIEVIRRTMRFQGDLVVEDMRYFEGPESPPSDKNYLLTVRRWYVKGHLAADPSVRGRWLVEEREFGSGVAAVAPYETKGYRSPHWTAFQFETVGPVARSRRYPGLPGKWAGAPYDFVMGEAPLPDVPGEALTIPGLPPEVAGCLSGT